MKPAPNFDRLAGSYRWLEKLTFGDLLWTCRCAHLDAMRSARTALILGDGDGRFTARLLEVNPLVEIDAIDASSAMLRALAGRAGAHRERVRTHLADARLFTPPLQHYDLVVTHFFLDCLTTQEITALATRLRQHLSSSSRWVISDFAVRDGWFGTIFARPLVTALYLAFAMLARTRVFRLPDRHSALTTAGFVPQSTVSFASGLLFSEIWTESDTEVRA